MRRGGNQARISLCGRTKWAACCLLLRECLAPGLRCTCIVISGDFTAAISLEWGFVYGSVMSIRSRTSRFLAKLFRVGMKMCVDRIPALN